MEAKDSKDEVLNSVNCTVVILTRDRYLFYGLKSLFELLAPKLLSKTSMFFDVVNMKNLNNTFLLQIMMFGFALMNVKIS